MDYHLILSERISRLSGPAIERDVDGSVLQEP